jgi:hypothetical protein
MSAELTKKALKSSGFKPKFITTTAQPSKVALKAKIRSVIEQIRLF